MGKKSKKSIFLYVASIFWNSSQRRLRALWRILGTLLCTAILTFVFGTPFYAAEGSAPVTYIEKIVLYAAAVVSISLATRFLDRRKFSDTGVYLKRNWWIDLGFGLLLGASLMTLIFLLELAAGWATIGDIFSTYNSSQSFLLALLMPFLLQVIVGFAEELMFRGYLLLNLSEGLNLRRIGPRWALVTAWVLTSAVFGIAHLMSPNATLVSSINITLIGLWLGLGYVLTGSLAIPIGIHIAWNFFQGYIYGFPVSGGRDFSTTVISIQQGGPALWTGGAFGPEAGLLGLFAWALGVLLVLVWVRIRYQKISLDTAIPEPPAARQASLRDGMNGLREGDSKHLLSDV